MLLFLLINRMKQLDFRKTKHIDLIRKRERI